MNGNKTNSSSNDGVSNEEGRTNNNNSHFGVATVDVIPNQLISDHNKNNDNENARTTTGNKNARTFEDNNSNSSGKNETRLLAKKLSVGSTELLRDGDAITALNSDSTELTRDSASQKLFSCEQECFIEK